MNEQEINAFKLGFCKRAAELGIAPSELLKFKQVKTAEGLVSGVVGAARAAPETAGQTLKTLALAGSLGIIGGGTAGALANYLYNKGKNVLDPEDSLLPEFSEADEAKKLHLIARYHNAAKELRKGLA
jgi:hypothetical protein